MLPALIPFVKLVNILFSLKGDPLHFCDQAQLLENVFFLLTLRIWLGIDSHSHTPAL